jgi:lysophospholipase L1-like esterase
MNATKGVNSKSSLLPGRCLVSVVKSKILLSLASLEGNSTLRIFAVPAVLILLCLLSMQTGLGRRIPQQLKGIDHKFQTGQLVTISAIGDSFTWICAHTDGKNNYVTFIADALKQGYPRAKIHLVLAGNLGVTSNGVKDLQKDVLDYKPDLVFIMFGMNDSGGGASKLDTYDSNLTEMIRRTQAVGAVPVILTQVDIAYDSEDGKKRLALPEYERRAVQVARRENCLFVNNFSEWQKLKRQHPSTWAKYFDDDMHPNLEGHRLIAKHILEKLWPEAAKFQYSGLPLPVTLSPGPCP